MLSFAVVTKICAYKIILQIVAISGIKGDLKLKMKQTSCLEIDELDDSYKRRAFLETFFSTDSLSFSITLLR